MSLPSITSMTPLTGTSNTVITITGTNLSTIVKVWFNQISVTPTATTPLTLTVTAPVQTGSVSIVVADNAGNTATSPTLFTYVNANQGNSTDLSGFSTRMKGKFIDLYTLFKNNSQCISIYPTVTCQSQTITNKLSIYQKNMTVSMDGSPSGDTVITFGNKKKVGWVSAGHGSNTLSYSYDGIKWNGLGLSIITGNGYAVGWNGQIWTAGGSGNNTLAYSYDGINWTGLGKSIFTVYCHAMKWGQNLCVAVGEGTNTMAYSYDGIHWTGLGSSLLKYGYSVNHNGNMWLAAGTQGSNNMVYSYDGILWYPVTDFPSKIDNGLAISWNGQMWLAGGSGAYSLAYSYDGITWTGVTNSNLLIGQVRGLDWNGTLWVASGYSAQGTCTIGYSYNGLIWTGVSKSKILTNGIGYGVSWNGQMFVMTGCPPNSLLYSYDGITWTGLGSSVIDSHARAICHSNRHENSIVIKRRRIVAGGTGTNTLAYSTDGINWKGLGTSFFTNACWGITWNGRIWMAVGNGGNKIGWSYDGITWNPVPTTLFDYGLCIAWNGKMWLAGGSGANTILYSYNGQTWNATANSKSIFSVACYSIDWNGTRWVAVGEGTKSIAYSSDGITWTAGPTHIFTTNGIKVVWNGKVFLAAGYGTNTLAYSAGGIIWAPVSSTINGHGLAWNGSLWMTCDGAYSKNAITWTTPTIPNSNPMYVTWTGKLWVLLGFPSNSMMYSMDGKTWTGLGSSIFSTNGICACSDLFNEYTNTTITLQTPVVALGTSPNTLSYSSDGIFWRGLGNSIFTEGHTVEYNGTRWVSGGKGTHTLAYSEDGINWIGLSNTIFTVGCYKITWNEKLWVAAGEGTNTLAYSYDGITWVPSTNTLFTVANTVAWNGTKWIAGGDGRYRLASSINGIQWTGITQTGLSITNAIETDGTLWVVGGLSNPSIYMYGGLIWPNSITWSSGLTWTVTGLTYATGLSQEVSPTPTTFLYDGLTWSNGVTWSNGLTWKSGVIPLVKILQVTSLTQSSTNVERTTEDLDSLIYSYDGNTWIGVKNFVLSTVESIAYNGKIWIAIGFGKDYTISYSYNGINWEGVPNSLSIFARGKDITWNGKWIATGLGTNTLAYSVDGIRWYGQGTSITTNGYGIGPRFVDPKIEGDLQFSTESYYQKGYTTITIGVTSTN